ncbi:MAG: tetratricopeptide repeat protein [Planctomycetes bacterium]|nr:tetratricopeptide repeat protein [Planctomycetota bacterium]
MGVYSRSLKSEFLNWDDNKYVYDNVYIQHGLTAESVRWAFSPNWYASNYHPLTWLSHALDISLFGLDHPWGHHLTSLLLHALNTALLVIVLQRLTGQLWPSVIVAALFGLHPVHVESVAWVSERKDVLSTLFMMLCLWAYVAWVRRPCWWRYGLIALTLVLSLLAKPMAVTLPAVMLLLDFWPLKRLSWAAVLEKLPLAVIVAGSCILTFLAQDYGGATRALETLGVATRTTHAVYAYAMYLVKTFLPWPDTLVPYYPLPDRGGTEIKSSVLILAVLVLTALTALALLLWRRRPQVTVGWLIYVGMLVPVIGLVQVGTQIMADRYLYVPALGLFIAVVWLVADAVAGRPRLAAVAAGIAVVVLAALGWQTWRQQYFWSNREVFWSHIVDRYPESSKALNQLARVYTDLGRNDQAIEYYRRAVEAAWKQTKPGQPQTENVMARTNLGNRYLEMGDLDEAKKHYEVALARNPKYALAHNGMGAVLIQQGKLAEGLSHFRRAAELKPDDAPCHRNLAAALLDSPGPEANVDEAIEHLRTALTLQPRNAGLYRLMAEAMARKGNTAEANRYMQLYRQQASRQGR